MVDSSREARFAEFRKQCGAQPGDPMDDFVRQIFDAAWQASRSAAIEECALEIDRLAKAAAKVSDEAVPMKHTIAAFCDARDYVRALKGEG